MNQNLLKTHQENANDSNYFFDAVMRPVSKEDIFRPSLEAFIRGVYQQIFNADLKNFLPNLVASCGGDDKIWAAFGYSDAVAQPLFLENYLDQSIDVLLCKKLNRYVPRSKIVEVGNLSITNSSDPIKVLRDIARYLQSLGYEWIVCTATRYLRLLFLKSGVKPMTMAQAVVSKVNADGTDWGNYYVTNPAVLVGNIDYSISLIEQKLRCNKYKSNKNTRLIQFNGDTP